MESANLNRHLQHFDAFVVNEKEMYRMQYYSKLTRVIQASTNVEASGQGLTWLSCVINPARVRPESQAASTASGDINIMPRLSTIN